MNKVIQEIRGTDTLELKAKLSDLHKEQFQLRFRGSNEQAARPSRAREIRRTIARILMVLGERERSAAATSKATS